MHEYPATKRICDIALEKAAEMGAPRVLRVDIVMGGACGYVASSVELYFEVLAEGTPCEGARLHFEHVAPLFQCRSCGKTYERERLGFECPHCGGPGRPTEVGREFYVKSIVLEEEE